MIIMIRIDIKEYNDFTHPYFIATSPDIEELLVEGKTMEEVVNLVPEILSMIFEEKQKIAEEEKDQIKNKVFSLNTKDVMMQYIYNKKVSLNIT